MTVKGSVVVLDVTSSPTIGDHALELCAGSEWVDFKTLQTYLDLAADPKWRQAAIGEATELFDRWTWELPSRGELVAALLPCMWVQTCPPWRPCVSLSGRTGSRKSTLLEALDAIFGRLSLLSVKTTAAGLRQKLRRTSRLVLLDEFESDVNRTAILELLRTSGKGGKVLRGTTDQRGTSFGLKHIVWTAGIESGLTIEADRNRFIGLELHPPATNKLELNIPGRSALEDLGLRLCAIGIRCVQETINVFLNLRSVPVAGIQGRVLENYALPAAMFGAATDTGLTGAQAALRRFLVGVRAADDASCDEQDLAHDIMASHVLCEGKSLSVGQIVSDQTDYDSHCKALEQCGIALCEANGKTGNRSSDLSQLAYMFLVPNDVKRHLLRGTRWAGMELRQLLLRLDRHHAREAQRHLNGSRPRGVIVPVSVMTNGQTGVSAGQPQNGDPVDQITADVDSTFSEV